MTNKFITLATAAVIATTAIAPAAEAGVKLGFGFPLGVFVASQAMQHAQQQNRQVERRAAAQRSAAAARERQQAEARATARARAQKQEDARAYAARAKAKRAQTTDVASNGVEVKDENPAPTIFVPGAIPNTGVSATATATTVDTASLPAEITELSDVAPTELAAETTTDAQSVTSNVQTGSINTTKIETAKAEPAVNGKAKDVITTAKRECRKYFPTVGRLVSVLCND